MLDLLWFQYQNLETKRAYKVGTLQISSKVVSRSGWGGGWRSLCNKIGYSERSRAESREGTSNLAESSRCGWRNTRFWLADDPGDVILEFDGLPTVMFFKIEYRSAQCFKIGCSSVQCNKIGYSSAQCIKIGYISDQCIKIVYISAQCIKKGCSSAQCSKIGYGSAQCIKVWHSSAQYIMIGYSSAIY